MRARCATNDPRAGGEAVFDRAEVGRSVRGALERCVGSGGRSPGRCRRTCGGSRAAAAAAHAVGAGGAPRRRLHQAGQAAVTPPPPPPVRGKAEGTPTRTHRGHCGAKGWGVGGQGRAGGGAGGVGGHGRARSVAAHECQAIASLTAHFRFSAPVTLNSPGLMLLSLHAAHILVLICVGLRGKAAGCVCGGGLDSLAAAIRARGRASARRT